MSYSDSMAYEFCEPYPYLEPLFTEPIPIHSGRPQLRPSRTSAAHNKAMRDLIRPFAALSTTPPGCQTVSFSGWTHFSSENRTKSSEDMTASALWAASGTTSDFDPPLYERVYLGTDQPMACGKPTENHSQHYRRPRKTGSSDSSWSATSQDAAEVSTGQARFTKKMIKTQSTSSLLTYSLNGHARPSVKREVPRVTEAMAQEHGIRTCKLSCSQLPDSCFEDSDDED